MSNDKLLTLKWVTTAITYELRLRVTNLLTVVTSYCYNTVTLTITRRLFVYLMVICQNLILRLRSFERGYHFENFD